MRPDLAQLSSRLRALRISLGGDDHVARHDLCPLRQGAPDLCDGPGCLSTTVVVMVFYVSVWSIFLRRCRRMRTPVEMPMPDVDLVEVHAWRVDWDEIARRIGTVFARAETRTRAMAYLASLLSPAERKKSRQLAERSGDQHPYGFQHLLGRADWEPEERRDRRRAYGTASLHAPDTVGGI